MEFLVRDGILCEWSLSTSSKFLFGWEKNDSNETIENLVKIFNDTTNNGCVQIYLSFIKIYAQKFINDLNFFQQENLPLFPFVEGRLEQLGVYIDNGKSMENFD